VLAAADRHLSKKNSVNGSTKLEKLIRLFAEIVDDGALAGNWTDCTLCVDAQLVALWQEVAPKTPVSPLTTLKPPGICIVFDADDESAALYNRWVGDDPTQVFSFFADYYPSVCARTFQPGVVGEQIGQGLVMFQTPRSGSHFMQGMLSQLKDFGIAAEWIRPPLIEAHALELVSVAGHLQRCARHQRAFHTYWAASIVLPFLETLMEKMNPQDVVEMIDFFSRGHMFMTMRKGRTAQTWSLIRASRSGVFHIESGEKGNAELDESLQPIEKFWFWNLINGEKIRDSESLARSFAVKVGKRVAEVPYEEMLNPVFLQRLESQVFGPIYDPIRYKLDPSRSKYVRQSTVEDAEIVARLESISYTAREIDFKRRVGIENATYRGADAGLRWGPAGLDIFAGHVTLMVWPIQENRPTTIAIQFTAAIAEASSTEITVRHNERELANVKVSDRGSYCLFVDGGAVSHPNTLYTFGVAGDQAQVVLVSIHESPVAFSTRPEFPWMREVQRGEFFFLCKFGVSPETKD
jgi:hypothetical protein